LRLTLALAYHLEMLRVNLIEAGHTSGRVLLHSLPHGRAFLAQLFHHRPAARQRDTTRREIEVSFHFCDQNYGVHLCWSLLRFLLLLRRQCSSQSIWRFGATWNTSDGKRRREASRRGQR
jgi:hypothetical protein